MDDFAEDVGRLSLGASEPSSSEQGREQIRSFLRSRTTYDLLEVSSKVVVFDVEIPIKLAYFALVEHDIRAAPLWDSSKQKLLGIVTVSDFVDVLRHGFPTNELAEIIEKHSILSWKELVATFVDDPSEENPDYVNAVANKVVGVKAARNFALEKANSTSTFDDYFSEANFVGTVSRGVANDKFVTVGPDDSLYDACRTLQRFGIHRLPVVDPDGQTCLTVLTHQSVLMHITGHYRSNQQLFNESISDLGIGTFDVANLVTTTKDAPLRQVLDLLATRSISCVPIVDPNTNEVLDLFARTYVCYLARHYAVETCGEVAISEILEEQYELWGNRHELRFCTRENTLYEVFVKFSEARVHRLVCVDSLDTKRIVGIVSLNDLLGYFL